MIKVGTVNKNKRKGAKTSGKPNGRKHRTSKLIPSKALPNSSSSFEETKTIKTFGLPEPDKEYIKANEDIWKKYLADRKRQNAKEKPGV